jgi:hypothetical protein
LAIDHQDLKRHCDQVSVETKKAPNLKDGKQRKIATHHKFSNTPDHLTLIVDNRMVE